MLLKIALSTIFIIFTHSAHALWVKIEPCDLLSSSDLIVEGIYLGSSTIQLNAQPQAVNLGVIKVNKIIKGRYADIVFIQQTLPTSLTNSSDISYKTGQGGIWFLTRSNLHTNGIYLANDPQRFWSLKQSAKFNSIIDNCK